MSDERSLMFLQYFGLNAVKSEIEEKQEEQSYGVSLPQAFLLKEENAYEDIEQTFRSSVEARNQSHQQYHFGHRPSAHFAPMVNYSHQSNAYSPASSRPEILIDRIQMGCPPRVPQFSASNLSISACQSPEVKTNSIISEHLDSNCPKQLDIGSYNRLNSNYQRIEQNTNSPVPSVPEIQIERIQTGYPSRVPEFSASNLSISSCQSPEVKADTGNSEQLDSNCSKQLDIGTSYDRLNPNYQKVEQSNNEQFYQCSKCCFRTKYKGSFHAHTFSHSPEVKTDPSNSDQSDSNCSERLNPNAYQHQLHPSNTERLHSNSYEQLDSSSSERLNQNNFEHSESNNSEQLTSEIEEKVTPSYHQLESSDSERLFQCTKCCYRTKFKGSLNVHLLSHMEPHLFKCPHCEYKTNLKGNLNSHIRIHLDTKLFKCIECSFETNQKSHLKTHLLNHSGVSLFKCPNCEYKTNWKGDLNRHLLTHSDKKDFHCPTCNFQTRLKGNLKKHMLVHSSTKLYTCETCNFGTNQKGHMRIHMLNHANLKLFKCFECEYATNVKKCLEHHILTHPNCLKCSRCNFATTCEKEYNRHLLIHSSEIMCESSECDYIKPDVDSQSQHQADAECGESSGDVTQDNSLQCDEHIHTSVFNVPGIKLFKCNECEYATNLKGDYKRHLLVHSNVKAFQCTDCGFQTKLKGNLKKHELVHSGLKQYKCDTCNFGTNQKGHLKIHLLNHSDVRLFKCSNCEYQTNRRGSLNLHALTHSDTKLYKCAECTFETNYKRSFDSHLSTHFNGLCNSVC